MCVLKTYVSTFNIITYILQFDIFSIVLIHFCDTLTRCVEVIFQLVFYTHTNTYRYVYIYILIISKFLRLGETRFLIDNSNYLSA